MRFRFCSLTLFLCILSCLSCETRDPEIEFQELSSTTFEPQEGKMKAQEYLNHFRKNKKAHIQEVSTIFYEYEKMADFENKSYQDYASLITDGKELEGELAVSKSPGIRNAWSSLYRSKRKRTQEYVLNALDEARFSPELTKAARDICTGTYLTWNVESISEVSIGPAELVEDGTSKVCSAEYVVLLRGNIKGRRTSNARVSTSGRYSFDSQGHLHFTLLNAAIIEGPTTVGDVAEGIMHFFEN